MSGDALGVTRDAQRRRTIVYVFVKVTLIHRFTGVPVARPVSAAAAYHPPHCFNFCGLVI